MSAASGARPTAPAGRTRRVRTPICLQSENTECGAACLGSVLAYHGRWVSLGELRNACRVGRDGSSAADVLRAARFYGLEAKGWRRTLSRLHEVPLPAIVFWEFNHFVVLEGVGRNSFHINDPGAGHLTVDLDTFDRGFTGIVLQLEKGPGFEPNAKPPGAIPRLWEWLGEFRPAVALSAALGLLLSIVLLVFPLMVTVLVDQVLILGQVAWGPVVVGIMAGLALLAYCLAWMQARALRRLAVSMSIVRSDRFLGHLLRLPATFFTHRFAGDLMVRAKMIDQVALEGASRMVQVSIEVLMCLAFLVAMLVYDPLLAAVVLALAVLWSALVTFLSRLRTDYNHLLRREQGLVAGLVMGGMRTLASIRAAAGENSFIARWGGYQANEINARQAFEEIGYVVEALPGLFIILGSAFVLGIGGWKIAEGEMTVGMLMGFYILSNNFFYPIGRLMTFVNELHAKEAELARFDDVLRTEAATRRDDEDATPGVRTVDGRLRLPGRVELRNVTFGFQEGKPPLIEDFSLTLRPGERVAITGPSGSGKTALSLLVAGFHKPWSGEILYDGHRIEDIPVDVFTASLGIVDQQPMLFSGSVRDNLTFWSPTVPDGRIRAAARDARVHETVAARPGGYDARVYEGGRNFSGGEQQRLEIARALVSDPSILILDEATSALDTITEVEIDRNLRRRGCSCLIVAHRLSTIRDSDLIIVMQEGREVQRGRHEDLVEVEGAYRRLVHVQ